METSESIRAQLGTLRRIARDYRVTLENGLAGKQPIESAVHSLGIFGHNRDLYTCNAPSVQPLKEFFRAFEQRRRLLHHVMSPSAFLLALRQELEVVEAEAVEMSAMAEAQAA